jgi:hypothetical protein
MLYNSNFDDSEFKSSRREFNKTIDDPCAIQQRGYDNTKKLKYITTNHVDLLEAKNKQNFYGMTIKDQLFVPSEQMNEYSQLILGEKGNIMTNCNVKNEYGQLPFPTMPSRYQLFHGDVVVEDSMRNKLQSNRKACNPKDSKYYERSFYIFDNKTVEEPIPINSVESHDFGPRGGQGTRFAMNKK